MRRKVKNYQRYAVKERLYRRKDEKVKSHQRYAVKERLDRRKNEKDQVSTEVDNKLKSRDGGKMKRKAEIHPNLESKKIGIDEVVVAKIEALLI